MVIWMGIHLTECTGCQERREHALIKPETNISNFPIWICLASKSERLVNHYSNRISQVSIKPRRIVASVLFRFTNAEISPHIVSQLEHPLTHTSCRSLLTINVIQKIYQPFCITIIRVITLEKPTR